MHDSRYGRRAVLGAGTVLGLATLGLGGCGLLDRDRKPAPPDPLEPLRDHAAMLAARYSAIMTSHPDLATRLTPLRDAHATHVAELTRLIGRPGPSGAVAIVVSTPAAAVLAELRTAEQEAARAATDACLAAPAARAALVGSIAACRATHVEVLA